MSKFLSALVVCALAAVPALAQVDNSEVLGTVHDASGSVVAKAVITLVNLGTNIQIKSSTDENGNFVFPNVKVGHYSVTAEATGFSKAVVPDVSVDVDARQRVDLTLQVGAITDTVEVTSAASVLETDTSDRGQVINTQAVAELPLNGRNYADLALLSTNAMKSPIAVAFAANATPREGAFNVNGMRSTYNNFMLDGLDNNAYSTSNQGFSAQVVQPSPDAIAEFKVITSNYSAEYGRVGGAVVNAVMKSGTNQIHGTVYEFLRNTKLNATGFLFSPAVFVKPTLHRNQFGTTIGGPFVKNRLFFFADYEGFRQTQKFLNFDSLPNTNDRAGVLPVPVVNPLTGTVYQAGQQIPLTSFASNALSALPANNSGAGRANNYEALLLARDFGDKYDAKIDGQINDRMSAFIRFSQRKDVQFFQPTIPGPSGGDGNGFIHVLDQNASIGYTWTVSSSSIFEARLGFSRIDAGKSPIVLGGPSALALYGIQGLPTTSNLTGGLPTQAISGYNSLGRQSTNPQFQNPLSWDPKFSYSKVIRQHSLKAGYEFIAIRTEVLDVNPLYGQLNYSGQFSKPTCTQLGQAAGCAVASDATSYNLADFYFGLPSTISLGTNTVVNLRQHVHSFYFQDDYRVTSKLTLNLGLRWDFATPLYDRDNNYSNFDPTTNMMVKATSGSLFNRSLVHPDYSDWGPRLGLAYSVDKKMVVRAGYGISYAYFNRPGSAMEGINAPQALFGILNQSIPAGGPVPATFLTTLNAFTTGIADPSKFNPATQNVVYLQPDMKWPLIQTWFLSVQRDLGANTVVELSYNANHALRLPIIADYNQANPNAAGASLGVQARRPIPTFGPITWVDPAGNNHYDGLSARVEHRFTRGLYFLNSFTWGKAIGDSEQALETYAGQTQANPQNIHNLGAEAGPTNFDVKLNNVTSLVYQLPFGKGRAFSSKMNPVLDAVLGGWEFNSINTAHTGTPLNVYYSPSAANDVTGLTNDFRGQAFQRPNVSGSAADQTSSQMLNTYFAGYTFTTPPANAPFGNLGRNAFRAPGFEQWDVAADKNFSIHERFRLQFRSEFFNVMNKTNFGIPTTITTSAAFGQIRTTYPARQIQFALKLLF